MAVNRKLLKIGIPLALALALLVTVLLASAVWDESDAVHVKAKDIENSTLAIGTHLIHLSALTDQIYDIAQKSADESGQNLIYYKSELAEGTWFDITAASTLKDITKEGKPVADRVVEALFFQFHTKSDGITYDLRSESPVNIYDIEDPYDLRRLDEMLPLKNQYDLIKEQQEDSAAGKEKIARIERIFGLNVTSTVTQECDLAEASLQSYYNVLAGNNGGADEMDMVQKVMEAVDATRRAEVYSKLKDALTAYAEELTEMEDTEDDEGNVSEASGSDTSLQSAVNDSLTQVSEALIGHQGKMLTAGSNVMDAVRYELQQKLITDANAPNHALCDEDVAKLIALENILNSAVVKKELELAVLKEPLLPRATDAYLGAVSAGANAEYKAAVAGNAAGALKDGIAKTAKNDMDAKRNELESYIEAYVLRVDNAEGIRFIRERLNQTEGYYARIPNDGFSFVASATVDAHVEFLTRKLRELELAGGGNELDKLLAEKSDLQEDYLGALDNNDLVGANEIAAKIAQVDEQIQALQDAQTAALTELQKDLSDLQDQLQNAQEGSQEYKDLQEKIADVNGRIAEAEGGMSDGTLAELVASLKQECLDIIAGKEGIDPDNLGGDIDALGGMLDSSFELVFPALKEILDAMNEAQTLNGDDYAEEIAAVEELILNNSAAYEAAMRTELTEPDIEAIASAYFDSGDGNLLDPGGFAGETDGGGGTGEGAGGEGGEAGALDPSSLGDSEKAAVYLLALQRYLDETGSTAAETLLSVKSQEAVNSGDALIYSRVGDPSAEYIPLTSIRYLTGMRYVWRSSLSEGTLARGAAYYVFTVFSAEVSVGRDGGKTETMEAEKYSSDTFGVECAYLSGTSYGVAYTEELSQYADELLGELLGAGGVS
jgi:hypothetical protein